MGRKRRSNRLTVEQYEAKRDQRESELNTAVMLVQHGFGSLPFHDAPYRSVSLRIARQMVHDGDAEQCVGEHPEQGRMVFFRELTPVRGAVYQLPQLPNAAAADALSQFTPGARVDARLRRRAENVILHPFFHDTRAPLVLPRVSPADIARARAVLGVRPADTLQQPRPRTQAVHYELPAAA